MAVKQAGKKESKAKVMALKKAMTKTEILSEIAANTELSKKQVAGVFEQLALVIERHIQKRGPGRFIFPGLFKIDVKDKPATKARKGINPFTKEETVFKAKPASRSVKIRPLKKIKEMCA